jgi:hypothetical protein
MDKEIEEFRRIQGKKIIQTEVWGPKNKAASVTIYFEDDTYIMISAGDGHGHIGELVVNSGKRLRNLWGVSPLVETWKEWTKS